MSEELHIENDPLLKFLQYLDSLVLVLLGIVRIMYRHVDQTRRRDLVQILQKVFLNYLEECHLLLCLGGAFHCRINVTQSE